MLSFKIIDENVENTIRRLTADAEEAEHCLDILSGCDTSDPDAEYAVCLFSGCLLIRTCFYGRYAFVFPCAVSDAHDVRAAIDAIAEYAAYEGVPLVFTSVGADELSCFSGYRHMSVDAEDDDAHDYIVTLQSECELLDDIPEMTGGRVTLNAITEDDIAEYARLCRDEDTLKYWGYDYRDDYGDEVEDSLFYDMQRDEFLRGVALSFAIRDGGRFVGSLDFYAFDRRGGASLDVRVLPDERRKGYARQALTTALRLARDIGLTSLSAEVINANSASIALFGEFAKESVERGDKTLFLLDF